MAPENNIKDGPMDRLAKRLFASPDSPFTAFADRQRVERLESCRQLELILKACQSANAPQVDANESGTNASSEQTDLSPSASRQRDRLGRYFKWNTPDTDEQDNIQQGDSTGNVMNDAAASFYEGIEAKSKPTKTKKITPKYSNDCAIETHELWACRALAVGCGNYLSDLRQCWSDAQLSKQLSAAGSEISFENGSEKSCRNIQVDMSKCVNKNAAELAERVQSMKKQ